MDIGIIGLGKMGSNIARNLSEKGFNVIGYDRHAEHEDIVQSSTLEHLVSQLSLPRKLWVMVPAGKPTQRVVEELLELLEPGDIIVDAGNSHFEDSVSNYDLCKSKGISFLDCGTSGGTEGALLGACFMVGGDIESFNTLKPYFESASTENGYSYVGPSGSGHYLKMIHNGIEYGMMQSIAEGFNILESSKYDFNYADVSKVWSHGSIISGYLMSTMMSIFEKDINLESLSRIVDSSGEGKWTLMEALKLGVATPVISASMNVRNQSSDKNDIQNQLLSLMRNEFGGHKLRRKEDTE